MDQRLRTSGSRRVTLRSASLVARWMRILVVSLIAVAFDATNMSAQGRWATVGRLTTHRGAHTATLLPTGKVLVVGGFGNDGEAVASAELYDPATGQWRSTGSLAFQRTRHTATLLPSGKVLVSGGVGVDTPPWAELYDPETETWSLTGGMVTPRFGHTATLLMTGQVLVVGGYDGRSSLAAAELYNPVTEQWTSTAPLAAARNVHTATLLSDGKVLVVGGADKLGAVSSAELYDPTVGSWTTTGSLSQARYGHTATLLENGKVLVTTGTTRSDGSDEVRTAELFNPASHTWSFANSLARSRTSATATLLRSGKVLVGGGIGARSAEIYDPDAGTWLSAGSMSAARLVHTATLLPSGDVLVAGGSDFEAIASAEIFQVSDETWAVTNAMIGARSEHSATLLPSGKVLVAGGHGPSGYERSAELFDPATATWSTTTPLLSARSEHSATLLPSGNVLVVGGRNDKTLTSVEAYDVLSSAWSTLQSLTFARRAHSATLLPNGKVLVVGGRSEDDVIASAELFDPVTGKWSVTGSLQAPRYQHTATLLKTGKVLVTGGRDPYDNIRSSAELYDPALGIWTKTGSLLSGRARHSATLLPNGEVLVAGGSSGTSLDSAELYDPAASRWSTTGSTSTPYTGHTTTLLMNGKVLIAGGLSGNGALSELYDPATGTWETAGSPSREIAAHTATLLADGRVLFAEAESGNTQLFKVAPTIGRVPAITTVSPFVYGTTVLFAGIALGGLHERSSGETNNSAVNYPLFRMQSVANGHVTWVSADARSNFSDDPMTEAVSNLPSDLDPGWNYLTPVRAGQPGVAKLVSVACNVALRKSPQNATVVIGERALFEVHAQGARHYQWEKSSGAGWVAVGDDEPVYTTDPVVGADSGTRYRVTTIGACSSATSAEAVITIADATAPVVDIVSPTGGEYWLLSSSGTPANTRLVAWSMSDNVRVCRITVSLLYSTDGGTTYVVASPSGGLPATFGSSGACAFPGETTASLTYTMPTTFPSGRAGTLYKIQVIVTDQAGNSRKVESANPFYIVQANPDSVKTLILWNSSRMVSRQGINAEQIALLRGKLQELANHPRVQGVVVDVSGVTLTQSLYASWDADPSNTDKANAVLFGTGGIHEYLRTNLLPTYSGAKYVIIVGDDRILPMARIQDRTILLPESTYPAGGDLSPTETTLGQALASGKYLSDDPLAVLDPIATNQLEANLYLPDLSIGRLVETPQDIVTAIATYISQDGILDLSLLDPTTGHKVLVTGYDFLSGVAEEMRQRWKSVLRASTADSSMAPVDGSLIGGNWSIGSVPARATALRTKLSGNGGVRYGIMALAGHATHYEEGVPGADPFDIQGLSTADIYGVDTCGTPTLGSIELAGSIIYAVGCHGGLSVPGSCRTDSNHSLDLPQTFLNRGALAYIANSGYGWGLRFGIGYSARLVQIFTEQLTSRGSVAVGDLVRETKQRYYLEAPRYDPYDEKTVMQWTLYGLPMYVIKTGIATTAQAHTDIATAVAAGAVRVRREITEPHQTAALALPSSLTQLNLSFDLTAPGVFEKHSSAGSLIAGPGCPDLNGCYYTLNGLVDRGTGSADLPIQPYLIYDSRLSGTSQHGALWKGGTYREESGWRPVIAQLVSNGGDGSNHGSAPRHIRIRPTTPRIVPGVDAADCRTTDLEVNSLTIAAGEAVKSQESDPVFSINRLFRSMDMEVFYFNNRSRPSDNCDRSGPALAPGPFAGHYHTVSGTTVSWTVPATDPAGVWRVLIVYDANVVDAQGNGSWIPLELTNDGSGMFRGSIAVSGTTRLTYVIQAVDNRGNVTWLDYTTTQLPSSGVPLGLPETVDVEVSTGANSRRRAVRH